MSETRDEFYARHRIPHPDTVRELRAALAEALDAWESWAETKPTATEHLSRIDEFRKLTEGP